eukprot:360591-Chlamydomonas_euryale.AAC.28
MEAARHAARMFSDGAADRPLPAPRPAWVDIAPEPRDDDNGPRGHLNSGTAVERRQGRQQAAAADARMQDAAPVWKRRSGARGGGSGIVGRGGADVDAVSVRRMPHGTNQVLVEELRGTRVRVSRCAGVAGEGAAGRGKRGVGRGSGGAA